MCLKEDFRAVLIQLLQIEKKPAVIDFFSVSLHFYCLFKKYEEKIFAIKIG